MLSNIYIDPYYKATKVVLNSTSNPKNKNMIKLLLSTLVAVGLSSTASAFVLDLSSLVGQQGGTVTQNPYGTFTVASSNNVVVSNFTDLVTGTNTGRVTLDESEFLTIIYPSNVTYVGAFIGGNATASANGSNLIYLSAKEASTVDTIQFEQVPEPSSTALLGLGGIALVLRRRK